MAKTRQKVLFFILVKNVGKCGYKKIKPQYFFVSKNGYL